MDDEPTPAPAEPDGQVPSNADIARAAFIHAMVSNLAMLALAVAVNVAVAKRDVIARTIRRFTTQRRTAAQIREARAINEFRREVTELSHADWTGSDG